LQALIAADLNAFYAFLGREGRVNGATALSPATVKRVHATLHRALRDATRWGMVSRNVAGLADPPRASAHHSAEVATWTGPEVAQFLELVAEDRLVGLWTLLATSGMRRGEAVGLRWADVDLDGASVSIRQSLVPAGYGRVVLSSPKTARGRRNIDLDGQTVAVLRRHRARQLTERLAWPWWVDTGLVFVREDGTALHPDSVSQLFNRHQRAAGLRRIRLHDLRHGWATLALGGRAGQGGQRPARSCQRRLHARHVHARCAGAATGAASQVAGLIFGVTSARS